MTSSSFCFSVSDAFHDLLQRLRGCLVILLRHCLGGIALKDGGAIVNSTGTSIRENYTVAGCVLEAIGATTKRPESENARRGCTALLDSNSTAEAPEHGSSWPGGSRMGKWRGDLRAGGTTTVRLHHELAAQRHAKNGSGRSACRQASTTAGRFKNFLRPRPSLHSISLCNGGGHS